MKIPKKQRVALSVTVEPIQYLQDDITAELHRLGADEDPPWTDEPLEPEFEACGEYADDSDQETDDQDEAYEQPFVPTLEAYYILRGRTDLDAWGRRVVAYFS
jgi:hypothetical protein